VVEFISEDTGQGVGYGGMAVTLGPGGVPGDDVQEFHRDGAMTWEDYRGRRVRFTDERMSHIIRHPEMRP